MRTTIEHEDWPVLKELAAEYYELKDALDEGAFSLQKIAELVEAPSVGAVRRFYYNIPRLSENRKPTGWKLAALPMLNERRKLTEELEKVMPSAIAPKFEVPYQVLRRFYENIDNLS